MTLCIFLVLLPIKWSDT